MDKQEFNKKCAEYMGYELEGSFEYEGHIVKCYCLNGQFICLESTYKPHKDMNQMAEVMDKLREKTDGSIGREYGQIVVDLINGKPIKQAMRDFITECWR